MLSESVTGEIKARVEASSSTEPANVAAPALVVQKDAGLQGCPDNCEGGFFFENCDGGFQGCPENCDDTCVGLRILETTKFVKASRPLLEKTTVRTPSTIAALPMLAPLELETVVL